MTEAKVPQDIKDICTRTLDRISHLWMEDKVIGGDTLEKVTARLLGKQLTLETDSSTNLHSNSHLPSSSSSSRSKRENEIEKAQNSSFLYDSSNNQVPPLKKVKVVKEKNLGKGWFDMKPIELDEKLKRDVKLVQLRNYIDPKRFYKNPDKNGKILHVGTIIEGPTEYFSSRLIKKDRKQSILEEILHDSQIKSYTKKTYLNIQQEKSKKRKIFSSKKGKKSKR